MALTRFLVLLAAAALFAASPASAAEDALLRAAKKEGKVTWYTAVSLPVAQEICKKFMGKHPGVECIVHRDGSGKLYQRYLQEDKGNIHVADVYHTSNYGHYLILKDKHLLPYQPKGTEKFNASFVTKHHAWTILRAAVLVPFYNTKKVSAADAPKSWKDLADPKWKDRMVHSHPAYSGFVTNGMLLNIKNHGQDYYKKLAANKPKIVQSALASIPLVARGEADVGAGTVSYGLFEAISKGEPLKVVIPTEGVPLVSSPNAILKKAPHPNAAKLFTDYMFSLEAQQVFANRFLYVGHPGVKYPKGLPTLDELKLEVIDPEVIKKENKNMQNLFRKLFGV
ncbi:MAG: hypothetical protein A3J27_09205 [Candidatus Tectomicrobia bacterium RIFCSPLOWO2_12_FULL_69_37]|nr:MAG: hypothetical protein A3J27_09205 [Candidatus Tectomicrobia bacterium RIFCSPLOWO2_12_FULL_69_37]